MISMFSWSESGAGFARSPSVTWIFKGDVTGRGDTAGSGDAEDDEADFLRFGVTEEREDGGVRGASEGKGFEGDFEGDFKSDFIGDFVEDLFGEEREAIDEMISTSALSLERLPSPSPSPSIVFDANESSRSGFASAFSVVATLFETTLRSVSVSSFLDAFVSMTIVAWFLASFPSPRSTLSGKERVSSPRAERVSSPRALASSSSEDSPQKGSASEGIWSGPQYSSASSVDYDIFKFNRYCWNLDALEIDGYCATSLANLKLLNRAQFGTWNKLVRNIDLDTVADSEEKKPQKNEII